jgi:hypothetical protein
VKRDVERSSYDARFVAEIALPTGKTVALTTDWKPSHWDELSYMRLALIADATRRAEGIRDEYGVTCDVIRVFQERRHTARVVETTVSQSFDSEHFLGGGE